LLTNGSTLILVKSHKEKEKPPSQPKEIPEKKASEERKESHQHDHSCKSEFETLTLMEERGKNTNGNLRGGDDTRRSAKGKKKSQRCKKKKGKSALKSGARRTGVIWGGGGGGNQKNRGKKEDGDVQMHARRTQSARKWERD